MLLSQTKRRTAWRRSFAAVLVGGLVLALAPITIAGAQTAPPGARDIEDACPPGAIPDHPFEDVADAEGSESDLAIDCIFFYDITQGTSEEPPQYDPNGFTRRDQMTSFIMRLVREQDGYVAPPGATTDAFCDDAPPHEENANEANASIRDGQPIAEGYPEGDPRDICPDAEGEPTATLGRADSVTRAQMASFIARAIEYITGADLPPGDNYFEDDDESVHEENINSLAAIGVVQGFGDCTAEEGDPCYRPENPVTRRQMALFLARALDYLAEEGFFTPPSAQVAGIDVTVDTTADVVGVPVTVVGSAVDSDDEGVENVSLLFELFVDTDDDGSFAFVDSERAETGEDGTASVEFTPEVPGDYAAVSCLDLDGDGCMNSPTEGNPGPPIDDPDEGGLVGVFLWSVGPAPG